MKMWSKEEQSLYSKAERKVAEEAFWIAAESYENSQHTYEDVWAAWDLVLDYTDDVDTRIATRDILRKQYAGFDNIGGNLFYVDSKEQHRQPFTRAQVFAECRRTLHPSWRKKDLEQYYTKNAGAPRYAKSGFGY